MKLHIDIETRSTVDLRKTGVYVYAQDPSTDVILARYCVDAGPILEWRAGDPCPAAIETAVHTGSDIIAHNAQFERTLWKYVLAPRYAWPEPRLDQWHCTMARARAAGLPAALDGATRAMKAPTMKDAAGHRLMLQMCKPRRVDPDGTVVWWDDEDRMQRLSKYCADDVAAERWLSYNILPLSATEREVWLADQRMNDRGVPLQIDFVEPAVKVAAEAREDLDAQMRAVTGGAVTSCSKVSDLARWLIDQGVELRDDGGDDDDEDDEDSVPELRQRDVARLLLMTDGAPREALRLRQEGSKTSARKVDAMSRRASADGRVRGMLTYHGASTGRWSAAGSGIQLQNLPRATIGDWETAAAAVKIGKDAVDTIYGSPLDTISRMLRGCIYAPPGRKFIHADLASIEARGVAWLAGQDDLVQRFEEGADVYCDMAASIFGRPITKKDEEERWLGKGVILGCGYGMAWEKFRDSCAKNGRLVEDDLARRAVSSYRETYKRIPLLWRTVEQRAMDAIRSPGTPILLDGTERVRFQMYKDWLLVRLPSGRRLMYRGAKIVEDGRRLQIAYDGFASMTRRWTQQRTYGARLVENIVQAFCRDVIAEAVLRLEKAGYTPILTVHDEIICEVDEGFGSLADMLQILTERPQWASDLPIAAEGKEGRRYQK